LQRVGQLMGQYRLLLLDVHPVEHENGLGLEVVIGLDLLLEQLQQEWRKREVVVKHTEFLEHDLATLHAFGAFVLRELFFEVVLHRGAIGDLPLDLGLDR
jgi:hypothetical protein